MNYMNAERAFQHGIEKGEPVWVYKLQAYVSTENRPPWGGSVAKLQKKDKGVKLYGPILVAREGSPEVGCVYAHCEIDKETMECVLAEFRKSKGKRLLWLTARTKVCLYKPPSGKKLVIKGKNKERIVVDRLLTIDGIILDGDDLEETIGAILGDDSYVRNRPMETILRRYAGLISPGSSDWRASYDTEKMKKFQKVVQAKMKKLREAHA